MGLILAAVLPAMMGQTLSLDTEALGRLLDGRGNLWRDAGFRHGLLGPSSPGLPVRHAAGPDAQSPAYVYIAQTLRGDAASQAPWIRRALICLKAGACLSFDQVRSYGAAVRPVLELRQAKGFEVLAPRAHRVRRLDDRLLVEPTAQETEQTIATLVFPRASARPDTGMVESLEFVGARVAEWVALFHLDSRSAGGAASFEVKGAGTLRFVITGLAGGTWEIWHNGFLTDSQGGVEKSSGVLYFEGKPGGYFLRRIG
mgnify:CR=1 FL=1